MRRRLNWKAVIILTVAVALLLPGGYFLHRYQVRANSRALLDQANNAHESWKVLHEAPGAGSKPAEEAKLLAKEVDYLRRFLGFVPDDKVVLERYGLLLADEQVATTPLARFRAATVLEQVVARD